MKTFCRFIFLCMILVILSCSTISVNYDYDKGADFTKIKTYNWMPVPEKAQKDELTLKNIKYAANIQLEAKGLKVDLEKPDILIALHGGKEKKVDVEQWGYSYGSQDPAWGRPYWARPLLRGPESDSLQYRSGTDTYEYEVGTLIIDIVDAKTKELIWRGTAKGEINPDTARQDIDEAVKKIFNNFPPVQTK